MTYFNAIAFNRSTGSGNQSGDKILSQTFSPTTFVSEYLKKSPKEVNKKNSILGIIYSHDKLLNKKIYSYIKVRVSLAASWYLGCGQIVEHQPKDILDLD